MSPDRPALSGWPVNLIVAGRRVVVVGAGRIAARKAEALVDLGAQVVVVATELGADMRELVSEGSIAELRERPFEASDLDGAWLVVTATGDAAVDGMVHGAADERRIWCNGADDPQHCSLTLMSVVRRGDLVVAIGTGGRSPALATHLKARIRAEVGPEYEVLLEVLSEAREELRATGRSSEDADWQRAFSSGIVDIVRSGRIDEAKELLRSCL
jgi:siroheme synthase-like protein